MSAGETSSVIGGELLRIIAEDAAGADGQLIFDDHGTGDSVVTGSFTGQFGTLTLNADLSWSYELQSDMLRLQDGENRVESFQIDTDFGLSGTLEVRIEGAGRTDIVLLEDGDTLTRAFDERNLLVATYFLDESGMRPWQETVRRYDDGGNLIELTRMFDSGRQISTEFSGGVKISTTTRRADGDVVAMNFGPAGNVTSVSYTDGAGLRSWSERIFSFDAAGDFISRAFVLDDGSETILRYDAGRIVERERIEADGTRKLSLLSDGDTEELLTFDATGQLTSAARFDLQDVHSWDAHRIFYATDGSIAHTRFDLGVVEESGTVTLDLLDAAPGLDAGAQFSAVGLLPGGFSLSGTDLLIDTDATAFDALAAGERADFQLLLDITASDGTRYSNAVKASVVGVADVRATDDTITVLESGARTADLLRNDFSSEGTDLRIVEINGIAVIGRSVV